MVLCAGTGARQQAPEKFQDLSLATKHSLALKSFEVCPQSMAEILSASRHSSVDQ